MVSPRTQRAGAAVKACAIVFGEKSEFKFSDVKKFEIGFWIICLDGMLFYSSFTSSITIATDQVKEMFRFTLIRAGDAISVPMLVIAVSMPLLGAIIDRIGKRL